ncbi:hypothetical protein Pla123a_17550 [Posidoniimonas polymericola]|uniref:Uncharacterized protein n=1 Tax=Posidoniimonas polymericola TaxID=2528002 RepID=A0A5C5YSU9_9BACT|nr:hypothetical protein [Posidoniimonas polymericola]TWT77956.1 hypothetical protein Pla123a_17550 [Posidoniimonas polymericola]
MLPFRVQCETCQSWLKVARESLVGQIHSCPKCGSMVHLVPGAEEAAAASAGGIAAGAAAPAPAAPQTTAPQGDFDSVDQLGLDNPAPPATPDGTAPATPANVAPVPTATAGARLSRVEALGNKVAIAVGAGGAALLVFGAVAYWLASGGDDPAPVALAEQNKQGIADQISSTTSGDAPFVATPTADEQVPGEPIEADTPEVVVDDLPPLPEVDERLASADPPAAEPADTPAREPAREPAAPAPDAIAATDNEPEPEPQGFDPLEFDPSKLDLVMLRGDRKSAEPAASDSPAPPEEPRLAIGWDHRVEKPAATDPSDEAAEDVDQQLAARAEIERVWVERGTTAFENHAPVDLARRLNDKLPELKLPPAPLADSVRTWSELAGVPVNIDPQALARAGVSPRAKVAFSGADATLAELLQSALKPLRLTYAERDGQLALARLGGHSVRTAGFSVADLAAAPLQMESLRGLVVAMVPSIDDAALGVDGQKLTLSAPADAHFDLAVFCERLRHARGLKQRTKYPAALLATEPPLARLESPLSRSATFSFISPTPLAEVLDYWRDATGLEIVVDWASAAASRIGPQTLVRCSSREQPWRDALDGVLHPLGLGWRVVDARTLQIATRQDAAVGIESTEFYPLAKSADGSQAAEELTAELTAMAGLNGPASVVRYDAPSHSLLIRTCDANHRVAYDWLLRNGLTVE